MLPVPSNLWKTCASAVVALTALGAQAPAQQASPATVHVTGVVRDAQASTPVRHARVTPLTTTSPVFASFTDDNGRFSIDVASNATLKVAKAGYVEETVTVARLAGTDPSDLQVVLTRGAAITGRVVDETGAPLQGALVVVWEMESLGRQGNALPTNDLGEFRVSGLSEGSFYVEAGRSDAVGAGPPPRVIGLAPMIRNAVPPTPPVRVRPGDSVDVGDIAIRTGPITPGSESAPSNLTSDNTGGVAGRVRDTRGRPLKASVDLLREGSETLATASNEQGWFRFDRVAPGAYFAEVARPGVLKVRFGQRNAGDAGTAIVVRAGSAVSGIDFVLSSGAAISGTVSDEYGEPVEGARIRILQMRRVGDRIAALAPVSGPHWGTSDDRGRYRVFGLSPGRYLVVADGESSPVGDARNATGYAPIFYPNATNVAFALPVTVDQTDVSDIDIAFRSEPLARISGTIVSSSGQPLRGSVMLGVSQRSGAILLEQRMALPTADGNYVFENVPPGDYVVQASVPGTPTADGGWTTEFVRAYVTVTGGEPVQVSLRTSPGARVRGRITVDAQPSRRPPVIGIGLPPVDLDQSMMGGTSMGVPSDSDGAFVVAGVNGPRRFVLLSPLDGWYIKAARVHGVEALDAPFDFGSEARNFDDVEVVVSPAAAAISGKVFDSAGEVQTDSAVVLFSSDSSRWYRQSQALRLERPSQNGEFRAGSLPPGSYYVVALSDVGDIVTSGDWQDPTTLDKLRAIATEVSVNESETRSVTLRLVVGQ